MKAIIEAECPTATVDTYINSLSVSVTYALANFYDIISRSTTGLTDARNESEGDTAWEGVETDGIGTETIGGAKIGSTQWRVGIVHGFGNNIAGEISDPSRLDIICSVAHDDGGYGDGLEIITEDSSTSAATARVAGVIAQIMTDNPGWNFHDARQAIRQTCDNYSTGWVKETGYGVMDKTAAKAVTSLEMSSPTRTSMTQDTDEKTITFAWTNALQTSTSTVIVYYDTEPSRDDDPTSGHIIYNGTGTSYEYNYQDAELSGTKYFVFHTSGSYSPIESFDMESFTCDYNSVLDQLGTAIYGLVTDTPYENFGLDISGRFYFFDAPSDATFPYATYYFLTQVPDWTFGLDFEEFYVRFNIFSKESSSANISSYSNHLCSLFDWTEELSLDEYYVISVQREFVTPPVKDGDVWQVTAEYKIRIEKK